MGGFGTTLMLLLPPPEDSYERRLSVDDEEVTLIVYDIGDQVGGDNECKTDMSRQGQCWCKQGTHGAAWRTWHAD